MPCTLYLFILSALTKVIGTDFVGLVSAHEEPNVPRHLVTEQLHLTDSSLLPLRGVILASKAKQFGTPTCEERLVWELTWRETMSMPQKKTSGN